MMHLLRYSGVDVAAAFNARLIKRMKDQRGYGSISRKTMSEALRGVVVCHGGLAGAGPGGGADQWGDAAFIQAVSNSGCDRETLERRVAEALDVRGTAFQRRVWKALREIPAGSTASYSEVASRIGSPKSARAVASACASNKIAVAIPCHRVLRTDGSLSGYRWGVERKRSLLQREKG